MQSYRGMRVCVAVSGGVDSVSLLHLFHANAEKLGITLSALTCEHGIRGEQSLRDLHFVETLCGEWNIPLSVYRADVPARAKLSGGGLEEEGRAFRYECFREFLNAGKADAVATAHHKDDYAETVLFRLARGTSLAGLAAIRERQGIIRPLLKVTRAEIEAYAARHGLPFVTDESNEDTRYTRNAIRNNVLPALEQAVNGASEHLVEFALRAQEDEEYLQSLALQAAERDGAGYRVSLTLPRPVFSRACLQAMRGLGCTHDYTGANVREIEKLKELQSGREVCLPDGLKAVREGDTAYFYAPVFETLAPMPFKACEFSFGGEEYAVSFEKREGALRADFNKFPQGAEIRTRREGDMFTPFGGGKQTLKEYLTKKKIPARVGKLLPVVANGSEVFAVFGVEISERMKITKETERAIYLFATNKPKKEN
ncbi:MAG: tRNA lysidine(34) synthetase TilS [Clostridia bacterium]|nr:tRNA lysidine(34) synthetase TilS [Clostridia bacterium]